MANPRPPRTKPSSAPRCWAIGAGRARGVAPVACAPGSDGWPTSSEVGNSNGPPIRVPHGWSHGTPDPSQRRFRSQGFVSQRDPVKITQRFIAGLLSNVPTGQARTTLYHNRYTGSLRRIEIRASLEPTFPISRTSSRHRTRMTRSIQARTASAAVNRAYLPAPRGQSDL